MSLLGAFGAAARRQGWGNLSWYSVVMEAPVRVLCKKHLIVTATRHTTLNRKLALEGDVANRWPHLGDEASWSPSCCVKVSASVRRCVLRLLAWSGSDSVQQVNY